MFRTFVKAVILCQLFNFLCTYAVSEEPTPAQLNNFALKYGRGYRDRADCDLPETCEITCEDEIQPCNQFLEELLCYIKVGECEMPRTNEEDVIAVIGLSGAGKSILVQFIANNSNTLKGDCKFGECVIIDESRTIGGGSISVTFLPNMIVDNVTNHQITPFFVMPGFDDTRNGSIAIANSFYMHDALAQSQRIKLVVVDLYNSFKPGERSRFKKLLEQLPVLIKNPADFAGGISLLVNRVGYADEERNIHGLVFMVITDMILDIHNLTFEGNKENAITLMKEFVKTNSDGVPVNMGYFRTPKQNGPLMDDPIFVSNKQQLRNLIWNNTKFKLKDSNSFGLPLKPESIIILDNVTSSISSDIEAELKRFAFSIKTEFVESFKIVSKWQDIDYDKFQNRVVNLVSADYSFVDIPGMAPSFYINKIIAQILKFGDIFAENISHTFKNYSTFLELVMDIKGEVTISEKVWVVPLTTLRASIVDELAKSVATEIFNNLYVSAEIAGIETEHKITSKLNMFETIQEKVVFSTEILNDVKGLIVELESKLRENGLVTFIRFMESEYSRIGGCSKNCIELNGAKAAEILLHLDDFGWRNLGWINSQNTALVWPINQHQTINKFFITLWENLSSPTVQSSRTVDLQAWWEKGQDINNASTFNEFHRRYSLHLPAIYNQHNDAEKLLGLLRSKPDGMPRLNLLLKTSLRRADKLGNELEYIVFGNSVSLRKVLASMKQGNWKTVGIVATDTFFLDDVFEIRSGYWNPNIVIISPKVWIQIDKYVNLKGKPGSDPGPNTGGDGAHGRKGENAGNAGDLYWIYLNRIGPKFQINVDGGEGGRGMDGNAGRVPSKSDSNFFVAGDKDYCKAYKGHVSVRLYPNTCNKYDDNKCYAGDDGVSVRIDGHSGSSGGPGGNAGNGGDGGKAAEAYLVKVDEANPRIIRGKHGPGGSPGVPGPGGLGGRYGETLVVTLDDVGSQGSKRCKEYSRRKEEDHRRGSSGNDGSPGFPGRNQTERLELDYRAYKPFVTRFLEQAEPLKTNEFFRKQTIEFLTYFKSNEYIVH